jgi:hypothetical protein
VAGGEEFLLAGAGAVAWPAVAAATAAWPAVAVCRHDIVVWAG